MALPTVGSLQQNAFQSSTSYSFSYSVPSSNQILICCVANKVGTDTIVVNSATYNGSAMTQVQAVNSLGEFGNAIVVYAMVNPPTGAHTLALGASGTSVFEVATFCIDGADLSGGTVASALCGTTPSTAWSITDGTVVSGSINPTTANALICDFGMINLTGGTLSPNNSQTNILEYDSTLTTGFRIKLGWVDGGATGSRTMGYTWSSTYGRFSYIAFAVKPASATPTLVDLSLSSMTANVVPGEAWTATITGGTSGSTITGLADDGTIFTSSGTTLTAKGSTGSGTGWVSSGSRTITLTEALAGATNTPHDTVLSAAYTVLTQVKVGLAGSSTLAQATSSSFTTTETPNTRLRVWNGTSYASFASVAGSGKGPLGIALGNYLLNKLGANYRVDLINGSLGGTGLQNWANGDAPPNGNYAACKTMFLATVPDIVILGLGGNDARADQVPSKATFLGWLRTLIGNFRTDLSLPTLRFMIGDFQRWGSAVSATVSTTSGSNIINATAVASGRFFVGQHVTGTGIPADTQIAPFGTSGTTGTGSTGTYALFNASLAAQNATATGSITMSAAGGSNSTDDVYWARGRGGEQEVAGDTNVLFGATCVDLPFDADDVHMSNGINGGNAVYGRRLGNALWVNYFSGTDRAFGPVPGSSTYYATGTLAGWITINFTTYGGASLVGQTSQQNLTGFEFFANGSPVTPVTQPFISGPNQVAALLDPGLSTVTYKYQEGANPIVTNAVFDNGPTLPVPP